MIDIRRIDKYIWEIPRRGSMRVPVRIFASENLLSLLKRDETLHQAVNVASLPYILKNMILMPDAHQGYGMPIGGVAAFDIEESPGIISPGMIGFDINCGIRVIRTNLRYDEVRGKLRELVNTIFKNVPAGVGETGKIRLTFSELNKVLEEGARWAVKNGYGIEEDLSRIESMGCLEDADSSRVSNRAKERGKDQLGTLGSGNHFLEIQVVDEIYDESVAKRLGIIEKDQVVVMVHCGSRGLGHQVASDYINRFLREFRDVARKLPDRELIYAEFNSRAGEDYFRAMCSAANFAWANRQVITHWIRESFESVFGRKWEELEMEIVYDVAHNIGKVEKHKVDGKRMRVIVHRKGATRAFPKGHEELIGVFREIGQPVLIPGSMGTRSYILIGQEKSMELSFGSSAHGSGRQMSRAEAKRRYSYRKAISDLERMGIYVKSSTKEGIVEEVPNAYKDVDEVVKTTHEVGISRIIVRLRPIGVIKG